MQHVQGNHRYLEISFKVNDDYISKAKEYLKQAEFAASKSIFPFNELKYNDISIDITSEAICLHYDNMEKRIEKEIPYVHILRCVEFAGGILLELTKKRFLYIPILDNSEHNEKVGKALLFIRKNIYRDYEKVQDLDYGNVPAPKKIKLKLLQFYQGKNAHDTWVRNALIILTIVCFILGSVFGINTLFNYRDVDYSEAVYAEGSYQGYEKEYTYSRYGRRTTLIITLESEDTLKEYVSRYYIDLLEDTFQNTEKGTWMQLYVHPKHANIIELIIDGNQILDFEETQEHIHSSNYLWFLLVVLMYGAPIILWKNYIKSRRK